MKLVHFYLVRNYLPPPLSLTGLKYGFDGTGRFAHSGMLKAATWIREDLKTHPRVAELLSYVVGPNPVGGFIYKDGLIDASQNISTPLAQVHIQFLIILFIKLDCGCKETCYCGS